MIGRFVEPFSVGRRPFTVLSPVVLAASLMSCSSEQDVASPVIAMRDSGGAYPSAEVHGVLTEKAGCLLLGDGVVFWPRGTSWDDERREVRFGGDFSEADIAPVDDTFTGGGGVFDAADDLSGILDESAEKSVRDCLASTVTDYAVLAYPA